MTTAAYKSGAVAFLLALCGAALLVPVTSTAQEVPTPDMATSLLITEVLYDPLLADEEREWIEVANLGETAVSLDGYGLGDEEQESGPEGMLRFPPRARLLPGQTTVVAQTARGFQARFGRAPDFEINDSETAVPDMIPDRRWGRGQVALANSGDELLLLDPANRLVDAISYGDKTTFFISGLPTVLSGQSLARVPAACDSDSAGDWRVQDSPSPGLLELEGACRTIESTPSHLPIGTVQGRDDVSPYLHQFVSFAGQVTGTMEDRNTAGITYYTLFVQDLPGREDEDPLTSNGIAVFLGRQRPAYSPGDTVRVSGRVTEYYGLTEIDDRDLSLQPWEVDAAPLPAEILQFPGPPGERAAYLEAREGMLVSAPPETAVLGPSHSGCGFALAAYPGQVRPLAHVDQSEPSPVILVQNASDVDCSALPQVKAGDTVDLVHGPLTYHFEQYKIVLQDAARVSVAVAPAPILATPAPLAGAQFRVATLNLEDYLSPSSEGQEDWERPSPAEVAAKRAKLAQQIGLVLGCPAIVAVQEVESQRLLQDLVVALQPGCGFAYQMAHLESADSRGIDVALLSDPRRVAVTGTTLRQDCTALETDVLDPAANCSAGSYPLFSRPPLEVNLLVDDQAFSVWVVHLKSKRGGVEETAERRLAQAEFLHELAAEAWRSDAAAQYVVLGDMNDMDQSAAWRALLKDDVLVDALRQLPDSERYSYVFDGMSELIDGIFVSPALAQNISDARIAHFNSDFPAGWAADSSEDRIAFRASDHDALVVTFGSAPLLPTAMPTARPAAPPATPTSSPYPPGTAVIRAPDPTAPVQVTATAVTADEVAVPSEPEGRELVAAAAIAAMGALLLVGWWWRTR